MAGAKTVAALKPESSIIATDVRDRLLERDWPESGIADNFIFNAVAVEEIEAPSRLIIVMAVRFVAFDNDASFNLIQIVDDDADMVQWPSLFVICGFRLAQLERIYREVELFIADMDCVAAFGSMTAPTDMPIK